MKAIAPVFDSILVDYSIVHEFVEVADHDESIEIGVSSTVLPVLTYHHQADTRHRWTCVVDASLYGETNHNTCS